MSYEDDYYYKSIIARLLYEKEIFGQELIKISFSYKSIYEKEISNQELIEALIIRDRIVKNIINRSLKKNHNKKFNNPYIKQKRY